MGLSIYLSSSMEWSPSRKSTVATQNVRLCWLTPRLELALPYDSPVARLLPRNSFTNKFSFHHGEHPPRRPLAITAQPTPFQPWLTAGVLLSRSILIYPGHGFLCRIRDLHQSDQCASYATNQPFRISGNTTTHVIENKCTAIGAVGDRWLMYG